MDAEVLMIRPVNGDIRTVTLFPSVTLILLTMAVLKTTRAHISITGSRTLQGEHGSTAPQSLWRCHDANALVSYV